MIKKIFVTKEELIEIGWDSLIPVQFESDPLYIEFDSDNGTATFQEGFDTKLQKKVNIHFGGDSVNYNFLLKDLDRLNKLPSGLEGLNFVYYNDHETKRSERVFPSEISEIIGDLSKLELKLYSNLSELNADFPSDFNFTTEPEYEIQEG